MIRRLLLSLALLGLAQLAAAAPTTTDPQADWCKDAGGQAISCTPVQSLAQAPVLTPTVSTSAYTAGFVMGGVQAFTVPPGAMIQSVSTSFKSGAYTSGVDWWFFDANPTGGGTTDRAALALVAADMPKAKFIIHATDCKLGATVTSLCQSGNAPQSYRVTGTTIWVVPQLIGGLTLGATSDVTLTLYVQP